MPHMKPTRTLLYSIVLATGFSAPALAALGGDAASVEADRVSLKGALHVTASAGYALHEIQTAAGLTVHEYLSSQGKVFAVSWHGTGLPDLRQMLGSYYSQLEQATSVPHRDHHHLVVETPELMLQARGHTHAYSGRAWAPALLPQNFSVSQIN
jgi:Protein of unknown function (DUF2844)